MSAPASQYRNWSLQQRQPAYYFAIALTCLSGCNTPPAEAEPTSAKSAAKLSAFTLQSILGNMPMNSDHRCTGICLVAEALLEGELINDDGCETPGELGQRIYESARTGRPIRFRSQLCWQDRRLSIESRESLEQLSTTVADLFKSQWHELFATEQGKQKLLAAQRVFIANTSALDEILDADPDKTDAFFLIGNREFPDGSLKDTAHVVLISKTATGNKVVYDPNDPGSPIPCRLSTTDQGLTIEWTCKYRDTGQVTRQIYLIGRKETFFRLALEK